MLLKNFKRRLVVNTAIILGLISLVTFIAPSTHTSIGSDITSGNRRAKNIVSLPSPRSQNNTGFITSPLPVAPSIPPAAAQPSSNVAEKQIDTSEPSSSSMAQTVPASSSIEPTQDDISPINGSSTPSSSCDTNSCSLPKIPTPPASCGCGSVIYRPYERFAPSVMCPMRACFE
jgi:hypothetical protein